MAVPKNVAVTVEYPDIDGGLEPAAGARDQQRIANQVVRLRLVDPKR